MIMAIDPGIASTGYAIGENNKVYEVGIIKTYSNKGTDFERTKKIKERVKQLINKYNIKEIILEDYKVYGNPLFNGGKRHGEKTIKVITALEFLADELGLEVNLIDHKTWKADFKRIWKTIVLSGKFEDLENLYLELHKEKQDHRRDALKMLIPKIINFSEVI